MTSLSERRGVGFLMLCAAVLGGLSVSAEEKPGPETMVYIVKRGDTLWDISGRFLKSPWMWPKLWEQNRYIVNPHLIFPGEPIALVGAPEVPAAPLVAKAPEAPAPEEKAPEEAAPSAPAPAPAPAPRVAAAPPPPEEPALLPEVVPGEVELVKPRPIEEVRPPVEKPGATIFYARAGSAGFITPEELAAAGAIAESREEKKMLAQNDSVYINRGQGEGVVVGDKFMIFDTGEKIYNPATGSWVGYKTKILGELEVREVGKEVSTAEITQSFDSIPRGTRIKPIEPVTKEITLQKTSQELTGYIVDAKRPVTYLGDDDVVYIDLGTKNGVVPGNLFLAYRPSTSVSDPQTGRTLDLPEEILAKLVVINAQEEVSTALITKSRKELKLGDNIKSDIYFQ